MPNQTSRLKDYIAANCIFRASEGHSFKNSAGKRMSWSFDMRPAVLQGKNIEEIAVAFWDYYGNGDFQIAGIEMSGIPMVAAICMEGMRRGFDVSGLIVRVKRKKHMGNKVIEGEINGRPVILIDDAVNSAKNAELARIKLENEGVRVIGLFCVVDFKSIAGVNWRVKHGIEVHSMFELDDFGLTLNQAHYPKSDYSVVWSFAAPNPKLDFAVAKSTPVLFENIIIFGSDCGIVWGVDKNCGRILWQFKTKDKTGKGVISSPVVDNGCVYFGSYDGSMYCLSAKTGVPIWSNKLCDWIGASPCIHNGRIYIGLEYAGSKNGGEIACLDMQGNKKWGLVTQKQLHSSPIVHEFAGVEFVITGTNDCDLYALDPENGSIISHVKTGGPTKYHCAAWRNLAVACAFDAIYVWDFVSGVVHLKLETGDINYSRPLIVGKLAFCGSADGNMYVIDMERAELVGTVDLGEKIHSSPALIDGLVWFGTSAGELVSMDPVNFEIMHRFAFPERLTCALVSDGTLKFVYAYDNRIWAIRH